MSTRLLQASFAAGELSPAVAGRVDLAKYLVGAAGLTNFLVHPTGGISNRPGTRYCATAADQGRLVPFQFSVDDAYVLEFTNLQMRVLQDGGILQAEYVKAGQYKWEVYPTTTDVYYAVSVDDARKLDLCATGWSWMHVTGYTWQCTTAPPWPIPAQVWVDGVLLTRDTEYSGGALATAGTWAWYGDRIYVYSDGVDPGGSTTADDYVQCTDPDPLIPSPTATIYAKSGTGGAAEAMAAGTLPTLSAGQYAYAKVGSMDFYTLCVRLKDSTDPDSKADGYVYTTYSLPTPYTYAQLADLQWRQSADTIFFAHPDVVPMKLVRYGHTQWEWSTVTFSNDVPAPTLKTAAWHDARDDELPEAEQPYTVHYKVSAVTDAGDESMPSAAKDCSVIFPWPAGSYVAVRWRAVPNAAYYNIYKSLHGTGAYGWIGMSTTTQFDDDYITPDTTHGPLDASTGSVFGTAGDYPRTLELYQQRLFYAGTANNPQTLWSSRTGTLTNFSTSIPLNDADAIEVTLAQKRQNDIRHLVALDRLVALTSGEEWLVEPGSNSDALTPTSIQFRVQSFFGSATVPPLVIHNGLVYLERYGHQVRDLVYDVEKEAFKTGSLCLLAAHLLQDNAVVDWCFQEHPDNIVWAVRDDGTLLSFTYLAEQDVYAWAKHTLGGTAVVESCCAIPGDDYDEVYFLVNRAGTRTIELLTDRVSDDSIADAFFVDCGLSHGIGTDLSSCPTCAAAGHWTAHTSFQGLTHLEGKAVAVLADGVVVTGKTVASGMITLTTAATKVHVGLAYTADAETLTINAPDSHSGSEAGSPARIPVVILRLQSTRGLQVGPDSARLQEMPNPTAATTLYTGDQKVVIPAAWGRNGHLLMRQSYPLPATVLALMPEVEAGD